MKIILSRKGCDSGYGGCASPIFPDGSMVSLPIPDPNEKLHSMSDLCCADYNLGELVRDLTARLNPTNPFDDKLMIHLDPYLRDFRALGQSDFLPALGQDSAAQTHLANQRVGEGDLFLFFGWFRRLGKGARPWVFEANSPGFHAIFGWLQVGKVLKVSEHQKWRASYPWLDDHPHVRNASRYPSNNTIYVAAPELVIDGKPVGLPGGGTFSKFSEILRLTHPDSHSRTTWQLPRWFAWSNETGNPTFSYHTDVNRWNIEAGYPNMVKLKSVAKGQEFVLSGVEQLQACNWLRQLFVQDDCQPNRTRTRESTVHIELLENQPSLEVLNPNQADTARERLVTASLEWQRLFGVAPAITSAISEFDAARLVGVPAAEYSKFMSNRTAVAKGVDFAWKEVRYQVKANRPGGGPRSPVTLVPKAKNYDWDRLIWILYNIRYEIEEAWMWDREAYRKEFDSIPRLSPEHYRKGEKLA